MKFENWKSVHTYPAVEGKGSIAEGGIYAELNKEHYSIVRYSAEAQYGESKKLYRFSYDLETDENVKCQIAYTWKDVEGNLLFRAHVPEDDAVTSPENAAVLELDVTFYGNGGGKGSLHNMTVECVGTYQPKIVKLAALMITGKEKPSFEYNLKIAAERIDTAAAEGADLVLLPETYNTRAIPNLKSWEGAAKMTDPAVTMLRDKAIQHKMYVSASVRLEDENGIISNTVLIFGREGELVGTYAKCHLTMGEIWNGFLPGDDIKVFDTELGRLGCSTCWDRFFPEHARVLFMKKADIILNSTASSRYPIESCHNGYSNAAIIVTAQTTKDHEITRITGRNGQVLAMADPEKGYAIAEVDVAAYDPVFWLSAPDADTDPRSVYRYERRPDLYSTLLEK